MTRRERRAGVQVLLALIADHLEDFVDGDELALESLGEVIEQNGLDSDDAQSAILALRSLAGAAIGEAVVAIDEPAAPTSLRVLSAEERESLSPEAWGYLLDLRRRGSLDAEQFERVLDRLTSSGLRRVGVEFAREVAAFVALRDAT